MRPTSGSDKLVELFGKAPRLGLGGADDRAEAGQDLHLTGIAALVSNQPFQIVVKGFRRSLFQVSGEHRFGVAGRKPFAGIRRARLHENRPALRRARQVQRTFDLVVLALMTDRPHALRVGVASARSIVENRVIGPAIPQPLDHGHVLFGPLVALGMADLANTAEVAGGLRRPGGDNIPADTAAADVIERAKLPREVIGLGVGGRSGRDQTDALCRHGQRGKRGDRLEPVERCRLDVIPQPQDVGQEDRVEQTGLRPSAPSPRCTEYRSAAVSMIWMPPRGLVMATALDKKIEMHDPFHTAPFGVRLRHATIALSPFVTSRLKLP